MATKLKNLATTQTVKVVFSRKGNEFSTTRMDPIDLYDSSVWTDAKLAQQSSYCWHSDDWRLVEANDYAVSNVELPEWLSAEDYVKHHTSWKYVFGFCKDGIKTTIDKNFLIWLRDSGASECEKLAMIRLMETQTFRSDFRKSMKDRIVEFVNTSADKRQYNSPLSPRQMDCIMGPQTGIEARRISSNLYRS
jgi:hypothetical protein